MSDQIEAAERMHVMTPGGGGYGNPTKRDGAAVARDLADGKISIETARNIYGWAQ